MKDPGKDASLDLEMGQMKDPPEVYDISNLTNEYFVLSSLSHKKTRDLLVGIHSAVGNLKVEHHVS